MQGAMVLLMALSGLGCQNRSDGVADAPTAPSAVVAPAVDAPAVAAPAIAAPTIAAPTVDALPVSTAPPPYPRYYPEIDANVESGYRTPWDAMRATFCSFFLGKDPDVPTAREIEASVYGYGSGR
jgi:hypothetical protein